MLLGCAPEFATVDVNLGDVANERASLLVLAVFLSLSMVVPATESTEAVAAGTAGCDGSEAGGGLWKQVELGRMLLVPLLLLLLLLLVVELLLLLRGRVLVQWQ